jgi:hypothetical protein
MGGFGGCDSIRRMTELSDEIGKIEQPFAGAGF